MLEMETTDVSHQLATEFVLKTSENVFVTGKAGTGKTTFLRAVQKNSTKNTVVAAPTGVAEAHGRGGAYRRGGYQCRWHDLTFSFSASF